MAKIFNKIPDTMLFLRSLANPLGHTVKDIKIQPVPGDKILVSDLFSFDKTQIEHLLSYKKILTVEEVNPIMIGENNNYHWEYDITTKEFPDIYILGWHYKLL